MTIQELLSKIRQPWIQRVSQTLARGSGVRESFEGQLIRFLDLVEQAALTGDNAWVDPILKDWAMASTETDLERGQYQVADVMNRIIGLTIEVAREALNEPEALELIAAVLPVYTYALESVTRYEMEARIDHITSEMEDIHKNMEQLDRSKSNFISVAAHELKTPLTLIEGYSAMMTDAAAKSRRDGMDELLDGVRTGILRLRQIVDDMIDVSLIDNDLLSLNLQPVRLSQVLELLRIELDESINERKQVLDIQEFEGAKTWIYADPERIHQAIRNVLVNAIKFTPDGGNIKVDGRVLPGFIEVTITDTGIGISAEDQSLIFVKFGQLGRAELHSSGKTKFKGGGPGLGLAIARGIVEAHGGSIWAESKGYDEKALLGSTFHVLLPSRSEPKDPRFTKLFDNLQSQANETSRESSPASQPDQETEHNPETTKTELNGEKET
jgi:signal transduction histidine kinase